MEKKQVYEPPALRKVLLEVRAQILGTGCRSSTLNNVIGATDCDEGATRCMTP